MHAMPTKDKSETCASCHVRPTPTSSLRKHLGLGLGLPCRHTTASRRLLYILGIASAFALIAASPVPVGLLAAHRQSQAARSSIPLEELDPRLAHVHDQGDAQTAQLVPVRARDLLQHLATRQLDDPSVGQQRRDEPADSQQVDPQSASGDSYPDYNDASPSPHAHTVDNSGSPFDGYRPSTSLSNDDVAQVSHANGPEPAVTDPGADKGHHAPLAGGHGRVGQQKDAHGQEDREKDREMENDRARVRPDAEDGDEQVDEKHEDQQTATGPVRPHFAETKKRASSFTLSGRTLAPARKHARDDSHSDASSQGPDTKTAAASSPEQATQPDTVSEPNSAADPSDPSTDPRPIALPIFNDLSARLVRVEMDAVRRKYADAMRFLAGAPMAKVDVLVDPGVDKGWTNIKTGQGHGMEGQETSDVGNEDGGQGGDQDRGGVAKGGRNGNSKIPVATPVKTPVTDPVLNRAPDLNPYANITTSRRSISAPEIASSGLIVEDKVKDMEKRKIKRGVYDSPAVPLRSWIQGRMDVLYYGDTRFGEPEQVIGLDFDTGSADLWVPVNCQGCAENYKASASSRSSSTGEHFEVQYGSGHVSGTLVQDIVRLGSWSVSNQFFGAVDQLSDDFADNPNDGVMGMAFGSIASSGKKTYFENLIDQGSVKAPIFSFHMTRRKPQGSQLCVGCYDTSKYTGSFTWVPIISKTYWSVSMTGFTADGRGANALSRTLIGAIDTGTTLIYVPPRVAANFYKQIPNSSPAPQFGQGFYQYPCAADGQITLALGFNNKGFMWDVSDFNLGRTGRGSSMCVGAILAVADGFPEDLAIIGDVFLKSWYTIFDQSHEARIGLASSVNNS